jgi:hypothetical protein
MTLLMSAGMVQPDGGADSQKKLASLAQTARAARAVREQAPSPAKTPVTQP